MSTGTTALYGVFAATGRQGAATVDALLDQDVRVRALLRRPESDEAKALEARGVEVVLADLDQLETLVPAMEGLSALWFMTTLTPEDGADAELPMGRALGEAAVEAGVGHVVFSSAGGAERDTGVPHIDSKHEVEKCLQELDISVTMVRPVFFMENLPSLGDLPFATTLENDEVVVRMPMPDEIPLQLVSARDIGRVAARALIDPGSVPGGVVEIAGDERTGSQIAEGSQDLPTWLSDTWHGTPPPHRTHTSPSPDRRPASHQVTWSFTTQERAPRT